MVDALLWWLVLALLGLMALPITTTFFRNLPDRGYAFSRPIGLLLVAYLFWVLGIARVLPNSRLGVSIAFVMVLAVALLVLWRRRRSVQAFVTRQWRVILATEVVFALVFVVWGVIRSYTPAIAHTEQPMDFALLNAVLASPNFPPNDPWFAGEPISYYYFGYLMNAGLTQATGIASSITYNLALMSIAAMAATGVMSLVYNLVRSIRRPGGRRAGVPAALLTGVFAAVLLLFIGNLVGGLEFLRVNDIGTSSVWEWVDINGLTAATASSTWYPDDFWWWFRSTRVINTFVGGQGVDFTITEFPFFSFLLGDLHPHVMSLPFVLLAVAMSYNVLRSPVALGLGWLRSRPWEVLLVVLVLGSLGFLNSWDLPTFTALFLAALLLKFYRAWSAGRQVSLMSVVAVMAIIAAGAVALFVPFYVDLHTQASGILPVRRSMTRQLHFFLIWGPFLLLNLSLLAALSWGGLRRPAFAAVRRFLDRRASGRSHAGQPVASDGLPQATAGDAPPEPQQPAPKRGLGSVRLWAVALPLIPFVMWAFVELGLGLAGDNRLLRLDHSGSVSESLLSIGSRFWHLLPFFIILGLTLTLLFRKTRDERGRSTPMQFVLLLIAFSFFLTLGAELFHISDFFGNRMNTVFKVYYQTWPLMAAGGAVSLYFLATHPWKNRIARRIGVPLLMGSVTVMVVAAFVYVPAAIYNKAQQFNPDPTLNALAAAARADPQEFEAVEWLKDNAMGAPVIVEASPRNNGRPTGDYNPAVSRISQRTGFPTILGWPGHEHQWRGNPYDPIAERSLDVETIYKDQDIEKVQRTMDKYDVTYVIAGNLERVTYGRDVDQHLSQFMDIAFQNDGVVIYVRRAG